MKGGVILLQANRRLILSDGQQCDRNNFIQIYFLIWNKRVYLCLSVSSTASTSVHDGLKETREKSLQSLKSYQNPFVIDCSGSLNTLRKALKCPHHAHMARNNRLEDDKRLTLFTRLTRVFHKRGESEVERSQPLLQLG